MNKRVRLKDLKIKPMVRHVLRALQARKMGLV